MFVLMDVATVSFGGADGANGMLTDIQSTFLRFLNGGGQKIVDSAAAMAGALLAFQFLTTIIEIGISRHTVGRALMTFLVATLWYRVATNGVAVATAFASWMGSLGHFLGDFNTDIMKNPSLFVGLAVKNGKSIMEQMQKLSIISDAAVLLPLFLAWFFLWLCFVLLGAMTVFINIFAGLKVTLGIALLPFVIEPRLSFLADAGIGMIRDAGLQLGAMSLAIGISYGFLQNITLQPTATFQDAFLLCGAVFTCAVVSGGAAFVKAAFGGLNRAAGWVAG